jgi:fructose 1,6-bisphosphatase
MLATTLNCLWCMKKESKTRRFISSAWDTFKECANKASQLKLYAAGQDLLKTAFSGNVRGMGPGVAEIEIEERASDPIVVFAADKTSAAHSTILCSACLLIP